MRSGTGHPIFPAACFAMIFTIDDLLAQLYNRLADDKTYYILQYITLCVAPVLSRKKGFIGAPLFEWCGIWWLPLMKESVNYADMIRR